MTERTNDEPSVAARPQPGARPRPGPSEQPEPRPIETSRWRMAGTAMIMSAALAAFLILNVWLALKRSHNDDVEQARTDAVASAKQRVVAMLSYDYTDIDTYIANAPKNTTGTFTKEFTHLVTTMVAPAARRDHIDTVVTVTAVGVLDADEHDVTTLVLIDQATTTKAAQGTQHEGSQLEVTLKKTGGRWLVSYLTEI